MDCLLSKAWLRLHSYNSEDSLQFEFWTKLCHGLILVVPNYKDVLFGGLEDVEFPG